MTNQNAVSKLTGCLAVIWGLYVVCPYTNLFDRSPVLFRPMSMVAGEWFWGSLVGLVGLAALRLIYKSRTAMASFLLAFVAYAFAALYLLGDFTATAGPLWGCTATFNLFTFWERREEWKT